MIKPKIKKIHLFITFFILIIGISITLFVLANPSSCSVTGTSSASCTTCTSATTCCNYAAASCGGTNTAACTAGTPLACNTAVCCVWIGVPPAGYCDQKTCADVGVGDCETCAGCDIGGGCSRKACSSISNPDLCSGCDHCSGTWTIDDARGDTPWAIHIIGDMILESGGSIIITDLVEVNGCVKVRDADALKIDGVDKLKVSGSC